MYKLACATVAGCALGAFMMVPTHAYATPPTATATNQASVAIAGIVTTYKIQSAKDPRTGRTVKVKVVLQKAVIAPMSQHSGLYCQNHDTESRKSIPHAVPFEYCYDPNTSTNNSWHDYCSDSPDSLSFWGYHGSADFKGPCAYHDLCLESRHNHGYCDPILLSYMDDECRAAWGTGVHRNICYADAKTYYYAIKVATWV